MSWEALGAIAEAAGAIAVAATLVVLLVQQRKLATQIEQHSLAIKLSAYAARAGQLASWQHDTALDADLSRILRTAAAASHYGDTSLDDVGWWRFSLAMRAVFGVHEDLFYQFKAGAVDASYWAHRREWLKQLVSQNAAFRGWWERERESGAYVREFTTAIDETEPSIPGEHLYGRSEA